MHIAQTPESAPDETPATDKLPPNLLLNLGPYNRKRKVKGIFILACALQMGLIALYATMKFTKLLRGQFRIFTYSFICATAGTLILFFGLIITACLISRRNEQIIWERTIHCPPRPLVIWLQRGLAGDDHDKFTSCIVVKRIRSEFLESHRKELPRSPNLSKLLAMFAFCCVGGGYASQVIGVGGMHYPTQFALFGITLVMVPARMYLRQMPKPDTVVKTCPDYETISLSLVIVLCVDDIVNIERVPSVTIFAGEEQKVGLNRPSPRMDNLFNTWELIEDACEWSCPATEKTQSIVRAMEQVANSWNIRGSTLEWKLPVHCHGRWLGNLTLSMRRRGTWKADEKRVRFALSIWLFYYNQKRTIPPRASSVLFLGPEEISRRLENFWPQSTNTYFERLRYLKLESSGQIDANPPYTREIDRDHIVGFQDKFGFGSPYQKQLYIPFRIARHWEFQMATVFPGYVPAILMTCDIPSLFARHIFLSFMREYAGKVNPDYVIDLVTANSSTANERETLMRLADYIAGTGLGDQHVALLMVLAPLTLSRIKREAQFPSQDNSYGVSF